MGYHKPDGKCWSGECQNIGTHSIGSGADGIEIKVCGSCRDRMHLGLISVAQRCVLEIYPAVEGEAN
jgi:hypothetical protein